MRLWLVLLLVAGCDKVFGFETVGPAPDAQKPFAKVVSLTQNTTETLTKFPVAIVIDRDPDLAAHAAADGTDIGFYDDAGLLPTELVRYSSGSLEAWVQVASLPPGTSSITMRYGGGAVARDRQPWPASAVGVWHASDAGTAMIDRSGHQHDADVVAGSTSPPVVPAIAGGGRNFNGATDRLCATDVDHSMMLGSASFSFEVWVFVMASHGGADRAFTYGGSSNTDTGYDWELGAGYWSPNVADGTTLLQVKVVTETLGQWVHLVAVVDRTAGELLLYEQGMLRGMTPIPSGFGGITADRPICFSGAIEPFEGILDEPRVYGEALDAAWIRASYDNLAHPDTTVSLGPETTSPP